jgi:hypothetical protein
MGAVTAWAQSGGIELKIETADMEDFQSRRVAGWRFRAIGDALLLISAWAGSWAVVVLLVGGLARLF